MLVLGLESSCDETAAAVVEDGRRVRGNAVWSQVALHAEYGGVVPELASRAHVVHVIQVVRAALAEASLTLDDIDAVAVTRGPGLVGALLVGLQAGKAIAWARGLPLVGVNHLEGHLVAVYLDNDDLPPDEHLALLVSGGNSELIHVRGPGVYQVLGATRDDAAGEAFDKVGKLLGLGYPAGPLVDRLAATGNAAAVRFPAAMRGRGMELSFSGLKTSAATKIARDGVPAGQALADFCASFQAAIVAQLVDKTALALDATGLSAVVVSGGVAANHGLRSALSSLVRERGGRLWAPPPRLCTDNAAMIAAAGYGRLVRGERADLRLNASASLPL
jgi:N6-L-threonylcarbamoyladenine synthase